MTRTVGASSDDAKSSYVASCAPWRCKALYVRDIVARRKTLEGRPFSGVASTVVRGDYLNLSAQSSWVICRVEQADSSHNCLGDMVSPENWESLMPTTCTQQNECYQKYCEMYNNNENTISGKWVSFTLKVLEYKLYEGDQTAVCGQCNCAFKHMRAKGETRRHRDDPILLCRDCIMSTGVDAEEVFDATQNVEVAPSQESTEAQGVSTSQEATQVTSAECPGIVCTS